EGEPLEEPANAVVQSRPADVLARTRGFAPAGPDDRRRLGEGCGQGGAEGPRWRQASRPERPHALEGRAGVLGERGERGGARDSIVAEGREGLLTPGDPGGGAMRTDADRPLVEPAQDADLRGLRGGGRNAQAEQGGEGGENGAGNPVGRFGAVGVECD